MKLKKLLKITKAKSYSIFVYDTKKQGSHDSPIALLKIKRKDSGAIGEKKGFLNAKVLKIIHDGNKVNIVCFVSKKKRNKYIERGIIK